MEAFTREYRSNRNIVFDCHYHVVWTPKYRRPVLEGAVGERLKVIAQEVCAEHDVLVGAFEVMPDHVHALLSVDPQLGVHRIVKRIKGRSARLLREEFPSLKSRLPSLWTNSYFVATAGGAPLEVIRQYVERQKGA